MAASRLKSTSHQHVRSISLPSRPQPFTPQVDEHLSRLRDSEASSSSLELIRNRPSILEDMYDSLDDLLLLPNTQKSFAENEKLADEVLDGYLRLLDMCAKAKDITSHSKQDLQSLFSRLRRRREGNELETYLNSRKQTKKNIQRSQKNFKNTNTNDKSIENEAISSMFLKVEEASLEVLETLILYFSGSKPQSKLSVFVNKNIFKKTLSSKDEVNEFKNVDVALDLILKKKTERCADINENVQSQLVEMGSSIEYLEEGLECFFRHLIKTRVSLLNILNN